MHWIFAVLCLCCSFDAMPTVHRIDGLQILVCSCKHVILFHQCLPKISISNIKDFFLICHLVFERKSSKKNSFHCYQCYSTTKTTDISENGGLSKIVIKSMMELFSSDRVRLHAQVCYIVELNARSVWNQSLQSSSTIYIFILNFFPILMTLYTTSFFNFTCSQPDATKKKRDSKALYGGVSSL